MRLTNKFGLPGPLVSAITGFDKNYQKSRIGTNLSVTQLIGPPLINQLSKEHWDELEEDVSDRIWSIIGSATHSILEHSATGECLTEERIKLDIDGTTVSGQADLYENETISDYKITSVWSVLKDIKPEWVAQLNCLKYLYESCGFKVGKLQIVAILRDWSKNKAGEGDYPPCQVKVIPVEVWYPHVTLDYLRQRVALHSKPAVECTPEEKWAKPTVYAVIKDGNKTAMRGGLHETIESAEEFISEQKGTKCHIDIRPGENTRCTSYCLVNKFCPYGNK